MRLFLHLERCSRRIQVNNVIIAGSDENEF